MAFNLLILNPVHYISKIYPILNPELAKQSTKKITWKPDGQTHVRALLE